MYSFVFVGGDGVFGTGDCNLRFIVEFTTK